MTLPGLDVPTPEVVVETMLDLGEVTSQDNLVDLGSGNGQGSCTTGNVHGAMFDDAFWTSGTAGGHMMACGFVSGSSCEIGRAHV